MKTRSPFQLLITVLGELLLLACLQLLTHLFNIFQSGTSCVAGTVLGRQLEQDTSMLGEAQAVEYVSINRY